ncbi:MAG: FMN-binding protein [Eubacteriales bacterium]|nr:FMN-binding protein [Eubacteriales bacterium]MDD4324303.1 FMN-binding protein [Eubacteriales bacterium]MDD4541034.1 FMN-binding protein [Eubacteriales bacterium]
MKRIIALMLILALAFSMLACAGEEGETKTLTGVGKGYVGEITVTVVKKGDKIVSVEAKGDKETPGISDAAFDEIPGRIVKANSPDVDAVSGATGTSNGIIYAVKNALDPVKYPAPEDEIKETKPPVDASTAEVFQGFGLANMGRTGPGKDSEDVQVWSVNQVFANVLFDGDGKILSIYIDQLEVATPNYDGDGMPHLTGFPGQSYNYDENHDETVDSVLEQTEEAFKEEIAGWKTKRQRGDAYVMGTGTWTDQIEKYEETFIGMTVEEVEDWFAKYTSDLNGRPLKDGSDEAEDKEKYDALSDDEKAMLADITTSATMSLNDGHGDIIAAIKNAYEARVPLDIKAAAAQGFGLANMGRTGPGKDSEDVQVWSVNQIFANTLFDADGKIVSIYIDQLEVATPNYDGDGMPHLTGFPGQSFNYDENHDGTVDSVLEQTEEAFKEEIAGWKTKRQRGDSYVMGTGTWTDQIEKYEETFIGMTVEEVEDWFAKYTSDLNGRPLKEGSDEAEDKEKYDALSDDEKAMLADITTSATMSLNDGHGDIIAAIKASFDNRVEITLTVG